MNDGWWMMDDDGWWMDHDFWQWLGLWLWLWLWPFTFWIPTSLCKNLPSLKKMSTALSKFLISLCNLYFITYHLLFYTSSFIIYFVYFMIYQLPFYTSSVNIQCKKFTLVVGLKKTDEIAVPDWSRGGPWLVPGLDHSFCIYIYIKCLNRQ